MGNERAQNASLKIKIEYQNRPISDRAGIASLLESLPPVEDRRYLGNGHGDLML
jgi:hypothetical protein